MIKNKENKILQKNYSMCVKCNNCEHKVFIKIPIGIKVTDFLGINVPFTYDIVRAKKCIYCKAGYYIKI